jgi:Archaeal PaREP1/PaREP8 family.
MYEVLDYKADPRSYVYVKVMETLTEGKLALEMLKKGMITNASSKAFITVKAMVSALVIKNFDKIVQSKSEKEKDWYERVGYSAPTTGLIGISYDLEKLGYDVQLIVKTALLLHSFSYNGFDPNFVNYKDKGEVERDILTVVEFIKRNIKNTLKIFGTKN